MHFPSKGKPKPADTIDFQRVGVSAEAIAKWIQERTDIQVMIRINISTSHIKCVNISIVNFTCRYVCLDHPTIRGL